MSIPQRSRPALRGRAGAAPPFVWGGLAAQAPRAFPAARVRAGPARPLPPPERSRVDCPESASPAPPPPPQVSPGRGSDGRRPGGSLRARRREGSAGWRHRSIAAPRGCGRRAEGEAVGTAHRFALRGRGEARPRRCPPFPRCAPPYSPLCPHGPRRARCWQGPAHDPCLSWRLYLLDI